MVYLVLALLLYTATILLGSAAARNANVTLVTAAMNTISAVIPIALAIPLIARKSFSSQKFGMIMALLAGVTIALFVLAINKAYTQNKVGIVTPVVFGGAIFLSTILSYFIFRERLTVMEMVGLGCMGLGLAILIFARATH